MAANDLVPLWSGEPQKRVVTKLFRMWSKRLLRSAAAHYMAAEHYEAKDQFLTQFNMISAIAVLFFSTNQQIAVFLYKAAANSFGFNAEGYIAKVELLVPLLSLLVVLSSAIQFIMQYSKKAHDHRQAGNEFSNLRRKIERYWSKNELHEEAIHALNRPYNSIVKNPPLVPKNMWQRSLKLKQPEIDRINRFFYCFDGEDDSIDPDSCP